MCKYVSGNFLIFFNAIVHEFDFKSCWKIIELFLWRLMVLYTPHSECCCLLNNQKWFYLKINLFFNRLCMICMKQELWADICCTQCNHFKTSQHKASSDVATVQESCTLLDTQSQQLMYKRRQVQLPAVFSQEKHTHFSQDIMASTLIN